VAVLYLTEQGSRLNREGDRFILTREGQVLAEIPAGLVEAVYVFGNVSLTTPVITSPAPAKGRPGLPRVRDAGSAERVRGGAYAGPAWAA